MATYIPPKKGVEYITYIALTSQTDTKKFQVNPTIAAGDFKVSIDGGALANLTTLPSVAPASSVWVKITLSTSEMNGDNIQVQCIDAAGAEWADYALNVPTSARQIDDLAYPVTSGRSMVVDASGLVDANAVKMGPTGSGTAQTARDVGASVLLSSGTGTGQLDFTSGVVKANLAQILGTALTETAGLIAAAFKQFFNVATPTGTMKAITAVTTVTTTTNLTNAPTAGDLTATMKTSIGTAVAASAVASVTGNVGGNVTGSVGSLGTQAKLDVNTEADTALADYDAPTHAELTAELATADDATLAAIAALNNLSAANIRTAVGLATANLDTQLADLPTNAEIATALGTADDAVLAAITAATNPLATAADQTLVKAVTNKLDTALELDGAVYRLTTNALEQAPTGAGGGLDAAQTRAALGMAAADLDTQLAALPTASENANAVLDGAAASHNIALSIGEKINAAGSSADPLLNPVPGAYVAGTAGNALGWIDDIKVKTDTIGASSVTVTSPVTSANTIELVQGDDYLAADSRQLDFTYTGQPSFTGATSVKLRFSLGTAVLLEVTGTVQSATTVRFQPTATQTSTLPSPSGTVQFEVEITLSNGHIITPTPLSSGRATVRAQAT